MPPGKRRSFVLFAPVGCGFSWLCRPGFYVALMKVVPWNGFDIMYNTYCVSDNLHILRCAPYTIIIINRPPPPNYLRRLSSVTVALRDNRPLLSYVLIEIWTAPDDACYPRTRLVRFVVVDKTDNWLVRLWIRTMLFAFFGPNIGFYSSYYFRRV